jgi:hypothetical protein
MYPSGFMSRTHKDLTKKKKIEFKGRQMNFANAEIQMANKCMKKCSISLALIEMQTKAAVRYYLILGRMAINKKLKMLIYCGRCVEKATSVLRW